MAASSLSRLSLEDRSYVIVAAIDFGTTYSGYAFSFNSNPNNICMNKNWGENLGFQSYKTPTSVLTGPDHQFVAFGHEAEQKYAMPEGSGQHYMYRHFKMILHQKQHLTRKTKVTSTNGHIRPALDIFVMAIKYLKEHLLEAVCKQVASKPDASLICWVITVPAIWSDEAKNFMREAAYKAGCIDHKDSRQLVISLEPEAASIHCRWLPVDKFAVAEDIKALQFKSKTKYLIIDAGGGTIDITAHEVLSSGNLKELHAANGGSWGGTNVDENFVNLLKKVLGPDFLNAYKQQCPGNWLSMMASFESQKKTVKPEGKSRICLSLPWSMASKYMEICKKSIEQVLGEVSHLGVVFESGLIVLTPEATLALFQPVMNQIMSHIKQLLKLQVVKPLSYILLVGGFGESPILQNAIQNITPTGTKLLVPADAQMSVIKGAVNFGQNKDQIVSRIATKTYGYGTRSSFIEGVHDKTKKVHTDNGVLCNHVFKSVIKKGESVEIGKKVSVNWWPIYANSTKVAGSFYATGNDSLQDVEYVDDTKFVKLGKITVLSPNVERGLDRKIEVKVEFGGTEIQVSAIDLSSGCISETCFDLLE